MALESFKEIPSRRPPRHAERAPASTVVWLIGEHDTSTVRGLSATLAQVIALDEADLVVDLTGVGFMDASTVSVLLRAHGFLGRGERSLMLRAPQSCARLVLHASGLAGLIEPDPPPPGALASWVDVPRCDVPELRLRYSEGA